MYACPICEKTVPESVINRHIDSNCTIFLDEPSPPPTQTQVKSKVGSFFTTPAPKRNGQIKSEDAGSSPLVNGVASTQAAPTSRTPFSFFNTQPVNGTKRPAEEDAETAIEQPDAAVKLGPPTKKPKNSHAPLAERMRPQTLDDVTGQELVGADGVLRGLVVTGDKGIPSMILWGPPGSGKTTIARLIAQTAGTRFVEINSTSSGVGECKRIFDEAKNELRLTGRKTIIFCDEIHRFSKSQQDVFLGPVESGQVTLIGATTENPSFKVGNALLSRCRTFTLSKLDEEHIFAILKRALASEVPGLVPTPPPSPVDDGATPDVKQHVSASSSDHLLARDDFALLRYLAAFADGDARTGLNLVELALDLCRRPNITAEDIKRSLTQTLVYDRAGDQHYDTISAFHKSVRGSDPDAALYYLARMLQSGEDPLYVARRMVVIASEDVGLADNTMLSLATAAYSAAEKIGMPECRINLAHCATALALAPKSIRSYSGLSAAYSALKEPGVAGLPIPLQMRNAPTKLMKNLGYGVDYKYNPSYVNGEVVQTYLPEKLVGRKFLGADDFGDKVDPDVKSGEESSKLVEPAEPEEDLLLNPDGD
ncbi:hypothetical protein B0A48_07313 [Cryoendolithus antarcticus]|uniref:UBZ4-type domain-containing protein n=1 Tax=Cryoendolithus antarcticus TaxID=1507870 RepID=A0A1V8T867_9PEZI|nr:hypothetical protein B0A48_07313 [Cryoendolithus antarcticus]